MHAKITPPVDNTSAPPAHVRADPDNGARRAENAAADELHSLIADVDDLVSRVADIKDSDHARVRDKARTALLSARDSLTTRAAAVQRHARQLATSTDDYVRASPWQALGVAALVGATVGYFAGRRR